MGYTIEVPNTNSWIICESCKTNLGKGYVVAYYISNANYDYVMFTNPNQLGMYPKRKSEESISQTNNTSPNWRIIQYDIINFPKSEEYDAYQILDFAKKIKFKPKYISFSTLEKVMLPLNPSEMKQLNIDGLYYCSERNSIIKSRYFEQYGSVPDEIFGKYCNIFYILMHIDDIGR